MKENTHRNFFWDTFHKNDNGIIVDVIFSFFMVCILPTDILLIEICFSNDVLRHLRSS